MMTPEAIATIAVAIIGMTISWAVWVSVSVFKHAQEIALIKQEFKIMKELKDVIDNLRLELRHRNEKEVK